MIHILDMVARKPLVSLETDGKLLGISADGGSIIVQKRQNVEGRSASTGEVIWTFTPTGQLRLAKVNPYGTTLAVFDSGTAVVRISDGFVTRPKDADLGVLEGKPPEYLSVSKDGKKIALMSSFI